MTLIDLDGNRLLTWLDVQRALKLNSALWNKFPAGILGVSCFYDGMEVRYDAELSQVNDWLSSIFGHSYNRDRHAIVLVIDNTEYPVEFIKEANGDYSPPKITYPLWHDITYLPTDVIDLPSENRSDTTKNIFKDSPPLFDKGPEIVSFHSFKGGVGRTTALMTYVAAYMHDLAAGTKKILIIDADLEAPGVSFWLDDTNRPSLSFVQFLEALHYPPAGLSASLDLFARELQKTSLNIEGIQRELYILPAALNLHEIQDMLVSPEHLARNPNNPWQLTDHIHALGARLGVDAVFIDLRAGLSELASPLLFDPRIDHFFVTTVAPQSARGMAEVLRRLYAFNQQIQANASTETRPTVILSLLTKELRDSAYYELALKLLEESYPSVDVLTPGIQWAEAEFQNTLMSLGSVREALDVLTQSSRLYISAKERAHSFYTEKNQLSAEPVQENVELHLSNAEKIKKLKEVCEASQFSDSSTPSKILAIEPLLNLGKHFSEELPNILMIGAKGAGKTFTFRHVIKSRSWKNFLGELGFTIEEKNDAAIYPIMWSGNIEDSPTGEIKTSQRSAIKKISGNEQEILTGSALRRRIQDAFQNPPGHWDDFWENLIVEQFGIQDGNLKTLNDLFISKDTRIIFIFDGIEDAFTDASNGNASEAIRALMRLPSRIAEIENRHIGAIVFVRVDYVQATATQNSGQLIQRFQPFRLQWNPENFLRLGFMLCCQATIFQEDTRQAESLRIDQLTSKLETLWGKKLGSDKSKEALSARWVYTALCDLKGNVQARDLVRFLKIATELEALNGQTRLDRLLAPETMRKAIPLCSNEKVEEAKTEISSLRRWTSLMEEKGIRNLKVPFSMQQAGLDSNLLKSLQEIGVIYEDLDGNLGEERLYLPEIYRSGLGFETSASGRPRTQALLKKNIGTIPL